MGSTYWNAGNSGGWGMISNGSGGMPNDPTAIATINTGGTYTVTIDSGARYSVNYLGLNGSQSFTLDVAGTLAFATGDLRVDGPNNFFAGMVTGASQIDFERGTNVSLAAVLALDAGSLNATGSDITLAGSQLYAGVLNAGDGVAPLQGYDLPLAGVASLAGETVAGAGTVVLSGTADLHGHCLKTARNCAMLAASPRMVILPSAGRQRIAARYGLAQVGSMISSAAIPSRVSAMFGSPMPEFSRPFRRLVHWTSPPTARRPAPARWRLARAARNLRAEIMCWRAWLLAPAKLISPVGQILPWRQAWRWRLRP